MNDKSSHLHVCTVNMVIGLLREDQ
uniref:Uncharacterized protein n=1 Tax=Anguilla anguilla TaxID=7936 RepID=A0A0E9RE88_ANGAN